MAATGIRKVLVDAVSAVAAAVGEKLSYLHHNGRYNDYRKKYALDPGFRFNGKGIVFYGNGQLSIGEESYLGEYSSIQVHEGGRVRIGKRCQMSHFVNIYTVNHEADKDYRTSGRMRSGDVTIGDYCWIGIKATILGPVTIGENSCVGANSVVGRDLPPHSISIGVPAKVVKFKSYLSADEQKELARRYRNVLSDELRKKFAV